jgi:hypothetical protein
VLGFTPTLRLLVLAPDDWATHAGFPLYGMPHTARGEALVVGETPADFWQGVLHLLDDVLTSAQRAETEALYGVVNGQLNVAPLADLIVVHELGHLFHEQVPFSFPRLWLMELFANLVVHTYLCEREPEQLPFWLTLPERMTGLPTERMQHHSLQDFERLYVGVGPENYVWYQFKLVVVAKSIYDAAGATALQRLYQTFASHKGTLNDAELADLLQRHVHPAAAQVLRDWPS